MQLNRRLQIRLPRGQSAFLWGARKTGKTSYKELDFPINFWRTKSGMEIDFVLGRGEAVIEIKGTNNPKPGVQRAIMAFRESRPSADAYVVCQVERQRKLDNIHIMPWRYFLDRLWAGKIIR